MKISIKHLPDGQHHIEFREPAAGCGITDHPHLSGEVEVVVEMEKRSPHFFLNHRVRSLGHFACDRCLDEFTRALEESTRAVFTSDPDLVAMADESIHAVAKDANEIDITDEVRDA